MSRLFRVFDDELTVGFCGVEMTRIASGSRFSRVRFDKERHLHDATDRDFIIGAGIVLEGERLQRPVVQRKRKKGTRNIKNKSGRPIRLLGWAMEPKLMASDNRKEKNRMLRELERDLHGAVQKIGEEMGLKGGLPSPDSYVVTPEVMAAAEKTGCADYFAEIDGQRFLSHDLSKIEAALKENYPVAVGEVMEALHATRNVDHLSMLSLEPSKEGGLFVVVMAPKGHHLKIEAKRFVEMGADMGTSKRLFVFPKPGDREVFESSFNDRKEGEVIGKVSSFPMVLEVACCVGNGSTKNVVDKSRFYLDPEYLLCMWMVLNRVILDAERYRQLKAKAETFTGFDPFTQGVS